MDSGSVEQRLQALAQNFVAEKAVKLGPAAAASTAAGSSKRAAVLVCLFKGEDGDLHVILTKRTSTLSTNPGEWSNGHDRPHLPTYPPTSISIVKTN